MQIHERTIGKVTVLDLEPPTEGEFSKELFGPHIENILERGERAIVINLTEMRWINSTAIGLLVAAFRDAKANNARMVFAGANPRISEIMKITGMLQVWKSYEDVDGAIASFAPGREAQA